jgi:diacylglycerol kinase family enzyme
VIKNERTTLHDAGIATSFENGVQQHRYFINFCGVGFDAFVVERAAPWKPYGQIAYLLGTMRWLFAYKKPTLKITTNNYTVETVSYLSLAGIGKYSGGGMMLTPCAEANDGFFSFTLAKNLSKAEVIFRIKMMYDGSICKHREVDCSKTTTVSINVVNEFYPVRMQADGDVLGTNPFTMTILPQALCVVVP